MSRREDLLWMRFWHGRMCLFLKPDVNRRVVSGLIREYWANARRNSIILLRRSKKDPFF